MAIFRHAPLRLSRGREGQRASTLEDVAPPSGRRQPLLLEVTTSTLFSVFLFTM